jgi:hypothetical protein
MSPLDTAGAGAQKVFISYRREDTAAHAGRLYDSMVERFGEGNVFMDVDIEPGVDFVERITEAVSGCLVLIVVMGRNWATVAGGDGEPRIADPADFVRLEVETALRRPEVTPIPVLVSGARMPQAAQLPEPLQPLARRNALELSDGRWRYDVGRLEEALDRLLGVPAPPAPEPHTPLPDPDPGGVGQTGAGAADPEAATPRTLGWRQAAEAAVLAGLVAAGARGLVEQLPKGSSNGAELLSTIARRGLTWALVGAALALLFGVWSRRHDLSRLATWGLLAGGLAGAIGAAVYGVPVVLPDENLTRSELSQAHHIDVLSFAVTGGILGGLLGSFWRPRQVAIGAVAGALAAAVTMALLYKVQPAANPSTGTKVAFSALIAAAVAGLTTAALIALARAQRRRAPQPVAPE